MNNNCLNCMYSENTNFSIIMNDMLHCDYMKCNHINSPHYNEFVDEDNSCRLFLDSNKYFLLQDRKEKLNNLKNK